MAQAPSCAVWEAFTPSCTGHMLLVIQSNKVRPNSVLTLLQIDQAGIPAAATEDWALSLRIRLQEWSNHAQASPAAQA
eukprot:6213169-Pleurochrysis_carterae.AAC.3